MQAGCSPALHLKASQSHSSHVRVSEVAWVADSRRFGRPICSDLTPFFVQSTIRDS